MDQTADISTSSGGLPARYRGRFAPSPTGPLHFGSLVAAAGSYLEARRHGGEWWVRIDDIDPPREQPGAADDILRTLERFGFQWDGPVRYQHQRQEAHLDAIERLRTLGAAYSCGCTRKDITAAGHLGPNGLVYPGTCRNGLPPGRKPRSLRLCTRGIRVDFEDLLQGPVHCDLERELGDFVIRRADGLFAYHLAAAIDDGALGITHVIRGHDLLWCTPPQIAIQQRLSLSSPTYGHLPVAVNAQGQKLSKQTFAPPLEPKHANTLLWQALAFLQQMPPPELRKAPVSELWSWAAENWELSRLRGHSQALAPMV
ncbi:MAG: tRNA glutamyl-Q(34) synthetase GluQRS [Ectothiorhodospiraceae bacterium]|nr:tRNA glutamyl-Q(34) synthetase GluQRS [Ectothiorhodospiraceae bacterium]